MKPSNNLHDAKKYVLSHLSRHRSSVTEAANPGVSFDFADIAVGQALIDVGTLWARFCRCAVLATAFAPYTTQGLRYRSLDPGIKTCDDILFRVARSSRNGGKGHRNEPVWHDPSQVMRAFKKIKHSHLAVIGAAFSVPQRGLKDIYTARNFYAHRTEQTALKVRRLVSDKYTVSVKSGEHPTMLLLKKGYGRPNSLLVDWIDEISIVASLLC